MRVLLDLGILIPPELKIYYYEVTIFQIRGQEQQRSPLISQGQNLFTQTILISKNF
jgi:hypothetical protein